MIARRLLLLVTVLLVGPGLLAGTAHAHHDGLGNLPEPNPHAFGIPQDLWDEGVEQVVDGDVPVVLDGEDVALDFPEDFWGLYRVGGDDGYYLGLRLVDGFAVGEILLEDELHAGLAAGEVALANALTGASIAFGAWDYVLVYPHPHYVLLHAGTPRERCRDLAGGGLLPTANYHNAVHIGAPGRRAFANAGHEIHAGTCEDAGY